MLEPGKTGNWEESSNETPHLGKSKTYCNLYEVGRARMLGCVCRHT